MASSAFFGKLFAHLHHIDLFGKSVELNFNRGKKSRTKAGGFFTLFFFGFWIWSVYNVGKDIYQRQNPTMSTADIIIKDPKPMVVGPDTFTIAFGYSEPVVADHYRNESIFTMRVTLQNMYRNTHPDGSVTLDWSETVLETETCTPEHFGALASRFATLQLDKLLCLKPNQLGTDSISIQGVYESQIFQYLQVSVLACNNLTSSVTCGTPDELEYYLGGQGFFAAYFTDIAVNTKDYEHPTTSYQNSIFTLFGNKGYKELYFMLDHVEIFTDNGWFTTDESKKEYIKFETITETTTMVATEILLNFQMKVATTTKVFSRSYIKIQSILAQANGLATVALMVLLFVMTPYANLKFNESIINELFEINNSSNLKPSPKSDEPPQITFAENFSPNLKPQKGPDRSETIALSIISPETEKCKDFETFSSSRKRLNHAQTTERYPESADEKPEKEPIEFSTDQKQEVLPSSMRITRDSHKDSMLTLPFQTDGNVPLREILRRAERRTEVPRRRSTFASMRKQAKSPSYISGPNNLITNRSYSKKPSNKLIESQAQEDLELKSIEMMLESFTGVEQDQYQDTQNENRLKVPLSNIKLEDSQQLESSINPPKNVNAEDEDIDSGCPEKKEDQKEFENQLKNIAYRMSKEHEGLNITFWDYLQSFVRKSARYKQKIKFLNAGVKMINERLDIFELFKNFREVEKLKLLLLDYEQAVLFENLPKPLLHAQADESADSRGHHEQLLRTGKLVPEVRKSLEVCEAYKNIAQRQRKNHNMIDSKLLRVYYERFK